MRQVLTIFVLGLLLSFQSFAQTMTTNENAMTGKIVTPEEAAKSALNVGANLPSLRLLLEVFVSQLDRQRAERPFPKKTAARFCQRSFAAIAGHDIDGMFSPTRFL